MGPMVDPRQNVCRNGPKAETQNMKKRSRILFLLLIVCIAGVVDSQVDAGAFVTYELLINNTDLSPLAPQIIWHEPHNCSGNILYCRDGFTLSFTLQLDDQSYPTTPDFYTYVLSSGGQSSHSNGVFVRLTYDKQVEWGVALSDQQWNLTSTIAPGSPTYVVLTWSAELGMRLFIDGIFIDFAATSRIRQNTLHEIDPFPSKWIGKANDNPNHDDMHPKLQVNNVLWTTGALAADDITLDGASLTDDLSVGCTLTPPTDAIELTGLLDDGSNKTSCRVQCANNNYEMAIFHSLEDSCGCMTFISYDKQRTTLGISSDQCSDGNSAEIFFATHAISDRSDLDRIDLSASVIFPSLHDYGRPGEPLTFIVNPIKVHPDVMYNFDFDDSTEAETTVDTEIGHVFSEAGTYTVKVTAQTHQRKESVNIDVTIRDLAEGEVPGPMHLDTAANEAMGPRAVYTVLQAFSEVDLTCIFSRGDGSEDVVFSNDVQNVAYSISYTEEHVYAEIGSYDVTFTSSNKFGSSSINATAIAVNAEILYENFNIGQDIQIPLKGKKTDIQIYSDETLVTSGFTLDDNFVTIHPSFFPTIGQHMLRMLMSEKTVFKKIYNIQRAIQSADIAVQKDFCEEGEDIEILLTFSHGSEVHIEIDFGDYHVERFYVAQANSLVSINVTHRYAAPDAYTITCQLANDINNEILHQIIHVERKLVDVEMTSQNITSLNTPTPFWFSVDMEKSPALPFQVEFDYDDGSPKENVTLGARSELAEVVLYEYTYSRYGIYRPCAVVFNRHGGIRVCVLVQVGENLTLVDVRVTEHLVEVNAEVELTFFIPRGSPLTLTVDMGDETSLITFSRPSQYLPDTDCRVYPDTDEEGSEGGDDRSDGGEQASGEVDTDGGSGDVNEFLIGRKRRDIPLTDGEFSGGDEGWEEEVFTPSPTAPPNDDVVLVYRYSAPGEYRVSVTVTNCFNEVYTALCPNIVVAPNDLPQLSCDELTVSVDNATTEEFEIHRSEEFSFQTTVRFQCEDITNYDIQAVSTVIPEMKTVHGQWRPSPDMCYTQSSDSSMVTLNGNTFTYGTYRLSVSVSLVLVEKRTTRDLGGKKINTLMKSESVSTSFTIVPSPLIAHIVSEDDEDTSVYDKAVAVPVDMTSSRDPDVLNPQNRTGFMAHLFCFKTSMLIEMETMPIAALKAMSHRVTNNLDRNVIVYDHNDDFNCFKPETSLSVYDFRFLFTKLVEDSKLTFLLVVTKDTREARDHKDVLVRSIDTEDTHQLLDLLTDETMMKYPGLAIKTCQLLADGIKKSAEGSESNDEMKEVVSTMMGKMQVIFDYTKDMDQISDAANIVGQVTENKAVVNLNAKEKAAGGLSNAAGKARQLSDGASKDKVENVFSKVAMGVKNVVPIKDPVEVVVDEIRRRRRRRAIDGEEADEEEREMSCCERYYGLCEWIQPRSPAVRFPKLTVWNNETCDSQNPDDIALILVHYDAMLEEKDNQRRAQERATAEGGMGACSTIAGVLGDKQGEGDQASAGDPETFMVEVKTLDKSTINAAKRRRKKRRVGEPESCTRVTATTCLPDSIVATLSPDNALMNVDSKNPFTFTKADSVNSKVVTLEIKNPGGSNKVVKDAPPITMEIAREVPDTPLVETVYEVTKDSRHWNYHPINITKNDSTMFFEVRPANPDETYEWIIAYEEFPNDTHHEAGGDVPIGLSTESSPFLGVTDPWESERLRHTVMYPSNTTAMIGMYRVGLRIKKALLDVGEAPIKNFTYHYTPAISSCKYYDEETGEWSSSGCKISPRSAPNLTVCQCTHLTSFGGDFVVPPNTIDFSTVFSLDKFLESLPVFFTVVLTMILYVILLIWARHMDKKDIIKWGAAPLEDNLPSDTYHYQLAVYTGLKKSAGTTSKVSFILSGDNADTGVRRLHDGKRKDFPKGSICNFIVSVENGLGPLTYLRIWHDNNGKGKNKGWFLDQVMISDLQTGEKFVFLCDRWLAVEEDDGMVERIIPVASMGDLSAFKHLFSSSVRKKLTNDHLWFSVVSRPTRSSFTRAQRISCCVSLLYLTMITNCMFFRAEENAGTVSSISLGPFSFTLHQLFISVVTTLIVFPPSLAIVTIFRKARAKKNAVQQENQQQSKKSNKYRWRSVNDGSAYWGKVEKSRFQKLQESVRNILTHHQRSKYQVDDPDESKTKRKRKGFSLPHWTIYIAWTLVTLSVVASGFFTILYSMEWGRKKSLEWLSTFLLSFFQSVIVVQPVKVLLLAAFVSCIMRKPELEDDEDGGDDNAIPRKDEELLTNSQRDLQELMRQRRMAASEVAPPDMEALKKARELRLKEMQIEAILKECLTYFFFVLVLFFLSYQTRDTDSFLYAENIKNTFARNSPRFDSISKPYQVWPWLRQTLLPNMYSGPWHNGQALEWREALQIDDRNTIRVGVARLRQLRVKDDTCDVYENFDQLIGHCRDSYNWVDDDAGDYEPGWHRPEGNSSLDPYGDSAWVYRSSVELKNAPYAGLVSMYKGGGFTFNFLLNPEHTQVLLDEIEEYSWLDPRTRALFVEFTLYNANVNLFASVVMVLEFMTTGGALSRTDVKVFRLSSYVGGFGVIVLLFEVIFLAFTLFFFVKMCRALHKKKFKYFKDVWDLLELATLIMSIIVIVMYAMKKVFGSVAMNALHESGSREYVNFVTISIWDNLFGFMMAIVVFLATVKLIKMLRFNRRMSMLGDTIILASKDLKGFSFMFFIYFMAFAMMSYLLFGTVLSSYGSFGGTIEALFSFALGSFDFNEMKSASILGPFFFFLYVFVMNIGLMGMFLTIIYDAFVRVKADTELQSNDYEVVDFLVDKFKAAFGCGK